MYMCGTSVSFSFAEIFECEFYLVHDVGCFGTNAIPLGSVWLDSFWCSDINQTFIKKNKNIHDTVGMSGVSKFSR